MRVSFLMPGYPVRPSGGFRVVYVYANYLASRGHEVAVIHPYSVQSVPPPAFPKAVRMAWRSILGSYRVLTRPGISWQPVDPRVKMMFLPLQPGPRHFPDSDFVFATARSTADFVQGLPDSKGVRGYLIQPEFRK